MNTEIRKIVLVPRYTTYAGARTYLTAPINVREFAYADIGAWRGAGVGSSPSIAITLQTSVDLDSWTDSGSPFDPVGEVQEHYALSTEWIRLSIVLGGSDPAFSCWVVGDFATRTPQDHGGGR